MTKTQQSQKQFIEWLKKKDPFLYAVAEKAYALKKKKSQGLGFISVADLGDFFKTAVTTVKDVAPQIIQTIQQKKVLDAQLKRAKEGLPPIDTAQYTAVAPYTGTPQQQQAVTTVAAQQVQAEGRGWVMPLLIGGLGLGLVFLLRRN